MAKLDRKNMKVFGSLAGYAQLGKIGSLAAGAQTTTTDIEEMQSLANYLTGWFGVVVGGNSPAIEDMNALCHVFAYQLAYLMQAGIPEWNSQTSYYIGSIVNSSGTIYVSLTDDNLNNAVTDSTKWRLQGSVSLTVSTNTTMTTSTDILRVDSTSGTITITMPTIASTIGQHKYIKNIGANPVIVNGNGSELIDGFNSSTLITQQYESLHLFNNGTSWDIL
jgi:hypothetical protein